MRYYFQNTSKDGTGRLICDATISVYLAGSTTAASIYTSLTGTSAVNSTTSGSATSPSPGYWSFYTDAFDYDVEQTYKIVISKSGFNPQTYDNVKGEVVLGTYTISSAKTITTHIDIPKGVLYAKSGSGSMAFNGPFEAGLYQVFDATFSAGDVTFGIALGAAIGSVKEIREEWFGLLTFKNTAYGINALYSIPFNPLDSTGSSNTAIGRDALRRNTTGARNSALGFTALAYNTTGNDNTGIGSHALQFNTTAINNTALGGQSLQQNTTGDDNTAVGAAALIDNTTGKDNVSIGSHSSYSNTTGINNTAIGSNALHGNTTGNWNTAIGMETLKDNTTGERNSIVGAHANWYNTTGSFNSVVGMDAFWSNLTGSYNSMIGARAGFNEGVSLETISHSVFIGYEANTSADALTNVIVIGSTAQGTKSNQVVLGNASIEETLLRGRVGVGITNHTSKFAVGGLWTIADNAAALAAGLVAGDFTELKLEL